jgi:hypothetical protein
MIPQLYGLLRVVVVFCFKLLMGVPWHAFPPEALLVRRIYKDMLPQISEKHAASVNSVEGVSFERRLIRRQLWAQKVAIHEVTIKVSSSRYYSINFVA